MVCIWGSPVSHGEMNVDQAKAYGKFLAERYKDEPNINLVYRWGYPW